MSTRKQYSVEYPFCFIYFIAWLRRILKPGVDNSVALICRADDDLVSLFDGDDSGDLFLLDIPQDGDSMVIPTIRQIRPKDFISIDFWAS